MDDEDRREAFRLIERFERKYFNGMKLDADTLAYYFGGDKRHWGSIIHNGAMPTAFDIKCLKCSIDCVSLDRLRMACIGIRSRETKGTPPRWITAAVPTAKYVIRRDGRCYNEDLWEKVNKKLDKVFSYKE